MSGPKKSFDYFGDTHAAPEGLSGAAEVARASYEESQQLVVDEDRRRRRIYARGILISFAFSAVAAWFLWGFHDDIAYVFSPAREPLRLGDVTEITPVDIPHNAYVEIHGITEHRGLKQEIIRGLGTPQEFWYFRLVGSRGVFIEVPPDEDRYGPVTEMTVRGRAIDPAREDVYRKLLASYQEIFVSRGSDNARIIQVGVEPAQRRVRYAVTFALLGGVILAQVVALVRLFLQRRDAR